MRKLTTALLGLFVLCFAAAPIALADTTSLQESLFVLDGVQFHNTFVVPGIGTGGFDTTPGGTGLGTLTFAVTGAGLHSFNAFFDQQLNLPFFNEFASVSGTAAAGQSWQIDDPLFGTIFGNAQLNTLDNTNHVPGTTSNFGGVCANVYAAGCATTNDDVSMAIGFNYALAAGDQALITLMLSHTAPTGGFFLHQIHPQDAVNPGQLDLYFSGNLAISSTSPVPEPSSVLLLGVGLCGLLLAFRHKV